MADIQRKAGFRVNRILKADLMIIDEIGYTPIERKEANLFFNLISELYEKASVIITSNKRFDEWAEMMGDEVMTVAMIDRLLHHSKVFNLSGESFRIQKEKALGQKVFLKFDTIKHDEENNLFCYLYLSNKTFLNAHLIKNDLVEVDTKFDYKYKSKFLSKRMVK